ncbi:hypothetical protein MASR2M74_14410 [Paracoccaceae bacterium]
MFSLLDKHYAERARLLLLGRYAELARHYRLPLLARMSGLDVIVETVEDMELHLRRHHVSLLRRGVAAMVPEIMAADLPCRPTQRVWVRWHEMGRQGSDLRQSEVVYTGPTDNSGALISGMEYLQLAMPEFSRPGTYRSLNRTRKG